MEKTYNPKSIEQKWYPFWEQRGHFAPSGQGDPFCIMIPPPNVTGTLHMGHAFQDTIMDALTRYQRMKGRNTLWQPGTDHAGIATQMVVERQLEAEDKTRHDLGREKFVERVWDWKEESGGGITRQLRRMGTSPDWSRERFTMDEGLSEAVKEVFVRLYEEDLLYRGKRLVNWDPVLHTAVSDLEVVSEEETGHLWHMRYPLADGSDHLVVATTRPETMLGDTAVAVNPEDERYRHLVGKTILLPLVGREIPIVADEYVDMEFGTGCVKITPAHDFNDYEMGLRHDLPQINILTPDACINENAPEKYRGMDRYEARDLIIHDLKEQDLLEEIEEHRHKVPRGDRSGTVIEPLLTDQWFVRARPLAEPAIEAVKDGRIRFIPGNWDKTYFNWMEDIQDWCISRQIWWGHRIPAWYDEDGNVYVGRTEDEVREKHDLGDTPLSRDEDVLDTWFSSALWPFSTLGWPEKTPELETFYPTSVLVTGFDIIFFWVARMIMMGLKFMDDVPFREVYVHGLVRDAHGDKMSKSKGNVLDPLDLIDGIDLESLVEKRTRNMMQPEKARQIEKATRKEFPEGIAAHGTDALRFTFAALASTGRDIRFDMGRIEGYRNFCNKLWNASRYVLMQCEGLDDAPGGANAAGDGTPGAATGVESDAVELSLADRWIIARLQQVEAEVNRHIQDYRLDLLASDLYEFIWHEYCDWYLELSKPVLNDDAASEAAKRGTRRTLVRVLETILRLAHPIMPFITEELWQAVAPLAGKSGDTIMRQPFPEPDDARIDEAAIEELEWVKQFIMGVRRIRSEMDIAPARQVPVLLTGGTLDDRERAENNRGFLTQLARLESIDWLEDESEAPESAIALVGEMKVHIPLAGLIDKDAEIERLDREIGKLEKEIAKCNGKLGNDNFVNKAPEAVVNQERERLADFTTQLDNLREQRARIEAM